LTLRSESRYNVCVFAYGQTGSGKTHTMEGPPNDPGINFRAMQELFRVIDTERRASHKHTITASIVEIYNEQVRAPYCSTVQLPALWSGQQYCMMHSML
jgi:Kinesin motor domain